MLSLVPRASTFSGGSSTQSGCIGDDGAPVDWFAVFKFPHGKHYAYADASSPSPTRSGNTLDGGAVGLTLNTLYKASRDDSLWAMFNDEPTNHAAEGAAFAHQKGVLFSKKSDGFWLVHSVPKFPGVYGGAKYSYPEAESIYGQSFLCMSLSAASIDSVAKTLLTSRPYVYDANVPTSLEGSFPYFNHMAYNPTARKAQTVLGHSTATPATLALTSVGGAYFTAYEKAAKWGQDLYEDMVAPALGSALLAETWMRPAMSSYCAPAQAYSVMNVRGLSLAGVSWTEGQDHSKWAITESASHKQTVCIGGVNRMLSQRKRGGGTVCFKQAALWKALRAAVTSQDMCNGPINEY